MNTDATPPADAFDRARRNHQAGRLAEAETMYRAILATEPNHADTLHLLGVLAGQTGRKEDAVDFIRQSIALRPENPEAHKNLGVALRAVGFTAEAIAAYRQAIALKPDYAEAHKHLGTLLYQRGENADAIAAFRQAVAHQPDFADAHAALGAALRDAGLLEESIASCRRAIAIQPGHADAYNNLGNALHDQRRLDVAVTAYRMALQFRPGFAQASMNLGIALQAAGMLDDAIAAYQKAVALKPDYANAFGNLGDALKARGRDDDAIAAYLSALALKPDSPEWRHILAALTGEHSPSTTPASHVRKLFDTYADEFDTHLTGKLHYRVPEQFLEAVTAAAPGARFDILDLGCGTGLCGAQFRPIAKMMAGVDLSPAMIAKAAARGIYDRLITVDIADAMRDHADSFDLLLAGDLFVYVGDLRDTFAAAARTLRAGGLFAFSIERHDGEGFILHSKIRFAHSLAYVRGLAHAHHFSELLARETTIRKSGDDDVAGWLVLLQKAPGPAPD